MGERCSGGFDEKPGSGFKNKANDYGLSVIQRSIAAARLCWCSYAGTDSLAAAAAPPASRRRRLSSHGCSYQRCAQPSDDGTTGGAAAAS